MGMTVGRDDDEEDDLVATINTTPLVDVMLVLLIIFLITVPVAVQTVNVQLPAERNQALQTKPENVVISIDRKGQVYWNLIRMKDMDALLERLKVEAVKVPQPEVHIRGDQQAHYQTVGQVMVTCQRAGITRVGFVLEPPPKS